jgi:hypothetical protein
MKDHKTLAVAAIITGASVPGFVALFGLWMAAGLSQQASADPVQVAGFAASHRVLYAAMPVLGVVMHLAALVLVVGLHQALQQSWPLGMGVASALGCSWVFIDILQNLMHYGLYIGGMSADIAGAAGRVTDALWHSGHLGGGVWVLAVGTVGVDLFGRAYRAVSIIAGLSFFLHPFVVPLVPEYFGVEMLLVPLWAFWTAALLFKREPLRVG